MSSIDPQESVNRLRHHLSQPLSVLLAEVQLMLMEAESLDPELVQRLHGMERQVLRMRNILKSET